MTVFIQVRKGWGELRFCKTVMAVIVALMIMPGMTIPVLVVMVMVMVMVMDVRSVLRMAVIMMIMLVFDMTLFMWLVVMTMGVIMSMVRMAKGQYAN